MDAGRARTADLEAALDRVEERFARLDRLTVDDLGRLALPRRDGAREAALDTAFAAADGAGRGDLLRDAIEHAHDGLVRRFGGAMLAPTFADLNWGRSLGTAGDRASLLAAVEEDVAAAVVEDLVDEDTLEELRATFGLVADLRPDAGHPPDESLANALSSPARPVRLVAFLLIALVVAPVVVVATAVFGIGGFGVTFLLALGVLWLAARAEIRRGLATADPDPTADPTEPA